MAQYSKRRSSNRRRQGGSNNPNRSMDSQGPDVKIRGTAAQIYDKYQALARDAFSAGDRIRGESLMQHAEHYYRLVKSMQPDKPVESRRDDQDGSHDGPGDDQVDNGQDNGGQDNGAEGAHGGQGAPDTSGESGNGQQASGAEEDEEARPRRRRRRKKPGDAGDEAQGRDAGGDDAPAEPRFEEAAAE